MSFPYGKPEIDIKFRFSPQKNEWTAFSDVGINDFIIKGNTIDEIFEQLKEIANKGEFQFDYESYKSYAKEIINSSKFIRIGFIGIIFTRDNSFPTFYYPEYQDSKIKAVSKNKLTEDETNRVNALLDSVNRPMIPQNCSGLDGRTYSIEIGAGWNSITYKWWSDTAGDSWISLYNLRDYIYDLVNKYSNHKPQQ